MRRAIDPVVACVVPIALLVTLVSAQQGEPQKTRPNAEDPPVNSSVNPPLTGKLSQSKGRGDDPGSAPPTPPGGKSLVYPPPKLELARDNRRVDPDVVVSVAVPKTDYRVMEPILLRVEITNTSKVRELVLPGAQDGYLYRTVRVNAYNRQYESDPTLNTLVPRTIYEKHGGPVGGKISIKTIKPDSVEGYEVIANLVNDMTGCGQHSIYVEVVLDSTVEINGITTSRVGRSEEIKVNILDFPLIAGPDRVLTDYSSVETPPATRQK